MTPGMGGDVNTTLPLVLAIVCTACCCLPAGVGGIIFSVQAMNAKKTGDMMTAQAKAKTGMMISIIGIVVGLIGGIIWGVLQAMANN